MKVVWGFRIADSCLLSFDTHGNRGPERLSNVPRVSAQRFQHEWFALESGWATTRYFINALQWVHPAGGGGQAGSFLIYNRGTLSCGAHVPCPRTQLSSALPWKPWLLERRGRKDRWQSRGSFPPTCPGGLEMGGAPPHLVTGLSFRLPASLFPPSWASSAGINTIKGMFSL